MPTLIWEIASHPYLAINGDEGDRDKQLENWLQFCFCKSADDLLRYAGAKAELFANTCNDFESVWRYAANLNVPHLPNRSLGQLEIDAYCILNTQNIPRKRGSGNYPSRRNRLMWMYVAVLHFHLAKFSAEKLSELRKKELNEPEWLIDFLSPQNYALKFPRDTLARTICQADYPTEKRAREILKEALDIVERWIDEVCPITDAQDGHEMYRALPVDFIVPDPHRTRGFLASPEVFPTGAKYVAKVRCLPLIALWISMRKRDLTETQLRKSMYDAIKMHAETEEFTRDKLVEENFNQDMREDMLWIVYATFLERLIFRVRNEGVDVRKIGNKEQGQPISELMMMARKNHYKIDSVESKCWNLSNDDKRLVPTVTYHSNKPPLRDKAGQRFDSSGLVLPSIYLVDASKNVTIDTPFPLHGLKIFRDLENPDVLVVYVPWHELGVVVYDMTLALIPRTGEAIHVIHNELIDRTTEVGAPAESWDVARVLIYESSRSFLPDDLSDISYGAAALISRAGGHARLLVGIQGT